MNAAARAHEHHDSEHDADAGHEAGHEAPRGGEAPELTEAPRPVEVRRNGGVAGLLGVLAAAVAIAWLSRAAAGAGTVAWVVAAATAVVAAVHLRAFLDARTPLLVADGHGVRIRLGRTWRGLPWGAVRSVEHSPGRGPLRDGRLAVHPRSPERFLADLDGAGRRRAAISTRLYGAPVAVPLGLSTRVVGAGEDVAGALDALAAGAALVTEVAADEARAATAYEPDAATASELEGERNHEHDRADDRVDHDRPPAQRDPRPWLARRIAQVAALAPLRSAAPDEHDDEDDVRDAASDEPQDGPAPGAVLPPASRPVVASATPAPVRDARGGQRAEVLREATLGAAALRLDPGEDEHGGRSGSLSDRLPEGRELRRPGSVDLVEELPAWDGRVRPIATAGDAVAPLVIDDFEVEPAEDPVIGPELAAARTRLGLSADQLAERTRIRPHVIESVEVDDFAPCGGDFYARGHLRTLARVLGVDAAPLLAAYDDRYAHAPIDARRVFEAELATTAGGSIRGTRGGPNWSVLVAAFMTVVLAWSVAQLLLDSPPTVQQPAPTLRNGSGGLGTAPAAADPVDVVVSAVQGGVSVEVRGGDGETVFSGDIAHGESRALEVVPPVQVRADDAGAVETRVDGQDKGRLGTAGAPATETYVVPRER